MQIRRALFVLAATMLLASVSLNAAMAQPADAPGRKITMVVGFAPGGGVDTLARVVAQELNDQAGYQVIVENRPGAGSNIAAKAVAGAAPDGGIVLFTGNSYAINQTIYKNPGYATEDLRPIAIAALDSQALAINAGNPARTLADFLQSAKVKPPSFGFGGSSSRIIAAPIAELVPQAQQGKVRVLAVTGSKRSAAFPDVPMLTEAGFPGLEIHGWIGILAPSRTPDDIGERLNAAVNAAVAKPSVNAKLRAMGYEPHQMPFAETAPFLKNSIETWRRMILATGMAIN